MQQSNQALAVRMQKPVVARTAQTLGQHMPGGTVVVEYTRRTPDLIRIVVRDTGIGLSAQQLAQLFQPLNRLGREHGMEKGMGLSLVVTKQLVELMGGAIGADSAVGEGSAFWIELKLTSAPESAAPDAHSAAPMQA